MKTIDEQQDQLDETIHLVSLISVNGGDTHKEILGYLLELKDRRESDLKPVTMFTQGKRFYDDVLAQFQHMCSEVDEVKQEMNNLICCGGTKFTTPAYLMALELIDLQTSCESMLQILGYGEETRRELRKKVISKNTERGYFDE